MSFYNLSIFYILFYKFLSSIIIVSNMNYIWFVYVSILLNLKFSLSIKNNYYIFILFFYLTIPIINFPFQFYFSLLFYDFEFIMYFNILIFFCNHDVIFFIPFSSVHLLHILSLGFFHLTRYCFRYIIIDRGVYNEKSNYRRHVL